MVEVLRYSQLGRQDLRIGTGVFEIRLGDGRVITLDEIRLTDFLSALTTGSVLFVKAGGVVGEDNSNFFWDAVNKRLGIGTASPSQPLHVVGIILSTQNLIFQSGTSFTGTLDHAITADRTWTLQDSTDTILGRATTDTLTNKTLLATGTGNVLSGILDRDVIVADVVNTITETTAYSFTVPANTLGTDRAIRLNLIGDYLNNSGGNSTLTVSVQWGGGGAGGILNSSTLQAITADAARRSLYVDVIISAANSTSSQYGRVYIALGGVASAAGTGNSIFARDVGVNNVMAKDSTVAQTLVVNFTHSVANANISVRALAVQLEILR